MKQVLSLKVLATVLMVAAASYGAFLAWHHFTTQPWTRDGRVRADIIKVAGDVSGLVTEVAVRDNQAVSKGDLLFVIDPARYAQSVKAAEADLAEAKAAVNAAKAHEAIAESAVTASKTYYANLKERAERRERLNKAVSSEEIHDSKALAEEAYAQLQQALAEAKLASANTIRAQAAVKQIENHLALAELDYARTEVRAAADGIVTNLTVKQGDYVSSGVASLALVKREGMWVYGYFEETKLPGIHVGDKAEVILMAGDVRVQGRVDSIASGIADNAAATSAEMLSDVTPTFSWVRLAQRVPVRIHLDTTTLPEGYTLVSGMSATVRITGNDA
ncbi:HlyD family secretion protein [Alteromonas sp. ZYF713]|nr:HlyD family secretion protein [Alteromonas sp. ZYF713]